MVITVHLHTSLQFLGGPNRTSQLKLELHDGASASEVVALLGISHPPASLILVVNQKVVDETVLLMPGDELHIIPAMSGGAPPEYLLPKYPYN